MSSMMTAVETALNGNLENVNVSPTANLSVAKLAAGSNGQVITTSGGAVVWGTSGSVVYDRVTTMVDVNTSTTETTLYSKSITGGDLSTNKMLRLTLLGDVLQNAGGVPAATLRVKLGATTMFADTIGDAATSIFANGAPRMPYTLHMTVSNLGAANSQYLNGFFAMQADYAAPASGIGSL